MKNGTQSRPRNRALKLHLLAGCAALIFTQSGCGNGSSASRYVPNAATAREALDIALNSWQQSDDPSKEVSSAKATIRMVDASRQAGQKLARYEITGESAEQTPVRFSVRLHLDNPKRELETNYVVVGDNPIWVFREEEYTRQQGM